MEVMQFTNLGLQYHFTITGVPNAHTIQRQNHVETLTGTAATSWRMSNAHLGVAPPSQLRFHAVDLDPFDNEAPFGATDPPSTSNAPHAATDLVASILKIVDAIAALFTHMNVIHTDLVEGIGLVHKRVDLIVGRQAHDIVSIATLFRRHTEFITEVNDFINNIRRL
ncbi:hypothetical protein Acr_28g0003230 [Actinidia rufa]|uniref:Uncharacterized protein n=1 Tax=Actinidia rufa TaxID=165716 RepID=A0A7J0H9C9_9ERIC|nr:hypothetical protein Acr_28g0003230 [Actinidia rufa]